MKAIRRKSLIAGLLGAAAGIAGIVLAHAGGNDPTTGQTPGPTPTFESTLSAALPTLEQQPTIAADSVPLNAPGTFFSAQNLSWPPLPGNTIGAPLWSLGGDIYVLDDLDFNYSALLASKPKAESISVNGGRGASPKVSGGTAMPYLTVSPSGTNGMLLTVINNTNPINYEIWTAPVLLNANWTLATNGFTGQTNFLIKFSGPYPNAFFRAIWDIYGVPAWQMADPNNPTNGALKVWIDSPANGALLQ